MTDEPLEGRSSKTMYSCEIPHTTDLLDIHQQYPDEFPFLLETVTGAHDQHRYSLLLAPTEDTPIQVDYADLVAGDTTFLERLDICYQQIRQPINTDLPFVGGWFLLLGYELAAQIEPNLKLSAPAQRQMVASAWRCDAALVIDHQQQTHRLVAESSQRLAALTELIEASEHHHHKRSTCDWLVSAGDGTDFCNGVQRIQQYILDGDVFQVNLSRGWQASPSIAPQQEDAFIVDIYRALQSENPAPFSGMVRLDEGVLISSSPERLLEVNDGWIQTRPIAGTRPRGDDQEHDLRLSDELLANPKERAEHIMLIDLERNDLGRVCVPGSIEVDELMVMESYASVHHIVSNVRGKLRPEVSPGEVIAAVFPGGTITGCPKVRCMEIISELEQNGRGFYTGAMGFLSRHGRLDMNILIRSMLWQDGALHWRTGCGIVADSVPEQELAETESKAAGMLRALASMQDTDTESQE